MNDNNQVTADKSCLAELKEFAGLIGIPEDFFDKKNGEKSAILYIEI